MRVTNSPEMAVMVATMAYDEEMRSTPDGQQAHDLLHEARELELSGQIDAALSRRHEAVALFAEDDDGAAASSARHDLAHSLTFERRLEDWRSIVSAVHLLRRALQSPARQASPMHRAQSENSLAVCLRMMSRHVEDQQREQLLLEAEQHYRSVISLTERCGKWGSRLLAESHLNLGNLLAEKGERKQALRQYEQALASAHRAERDGDDSLRHVVARARLGAASALRIRGLKKDLKAAEQYAWDAVREPEPGREDHGWLALAEIALAGDASDRLARAREYLTKVRPTRLEDASRRIAHARLLRQAGAPDTALGVLKDCIQEAIFKRARTIVDFSADTAAREFQPAAALAARILAEDKSDALGAFLQLENTSGMRFAEDLSRLAWRPRDPFALELYRKLEAHTYLATTFDGCARMLEGMEPAAQRKILTASLDEARQAPEDETGARGIPDKAVFIQALEAAVAAQVPLHSLNVRVEEERARSIKLKFKLEHHDADFKSVRQVLQAELTREELEALLREHPNQVLLRLSLEENELLALGVWLEEGAVVARSTSAHRPPELDRLLREVSQGKQDLDYSLISQLLEKMDLSSVLPVGRRTRAVLLPSHGAAALPLAALGPIGRRLMDRFDSLVWLAGLFPLRVAPAAQRPRAGHLVVDPRNTYFSPIALAQSVAHEQRLIGPGATPQAIERAVSEVETVCIYTHGEHEPGDLPKLALANQQVLEVQHIHQRLAGLERMEVWACQTGTNRAMDPFSPPADEAHGMDFLLLSLGVRTAIGTLWPVPDLVTAAIVRHYRSRLSEGADAASALLEAQRWWRTTGADMLLEQLRHKPEEQAIAAFAAMLGVALPPAAVSSAVKMLGPVSQDSRMEKVRVYLTCPVTWAAMRFVGLPECRSRESWSEPPERPLTKEECKEIEECLVGKAAAEPQPDAFRERQEAWLADVARLQPAGTPSANQALQVARMLRDRLMSSSRDNLLVALAWLHEALAAPELDTADRSRLSVEAAHLWIELAIGELWVPLAPHPVALARAERLLEAVPLSVREGSADALAVRARLSLLRGSSASDDIEGVFREALGLLAPALSQLPSDSYEALRVVTVALELLPAEGIVPEPLRARVLEHARTLASQEQWPNWMFAAWQRLRGALGRWLPDAENPWRAQHLSPPRELVEVTMQALWEGAKSLVPDSVAGTKLFSEALSQMESGLWGYPSDDRQALVVTTATPGPAYRRLLKAYLSGHAQNHPEDGAHVLACLQYACDLRVTFLGRLAWLSALVPEPIDASLLRLHEGLRHRLSLLAALADAALLPDAASLRQRQPRPHSQDPYALPAQALGGFVKDSTGLTAWSLNMLCQAPSGQEKPSRTAAFEAVRAMTWWEQEVTQHWKELLLLDEQVRKDLGSQRDRGLRQMLDPGLKLETNEQWLSKFPQGFGMLGLTLVPGEGLLLAAWWNDGAGPRGRVVRIAADEVQEALSALLQSHEEDMSPRRGASTPRRQAWSRLEAALAPALESLLREAQRARALRWGLLAPGALRALPLLGLRLGDGELLAECVEGLSHLPALHFGQMGFSLPPGEPYTACLLSPEREKGTTCFGESTVATLRGIHPPEQIVESRGRLGSGPDEVDALLDHAAEIRALRLYGVGMTATLNDTTALLRLAEGRSLMARNTASLPRCRIVELWACSAAGADLDRVHLDHEDHIPGLAGSFLACGAAAVIDLAWPVHDVIKALVCEQYGWRSQRTGHGPEMLAEALTELATMLRALQRLPASSSAREVLMHVDLWRHDQAQACLGARASIKPFEAHEDSPAVAGLSGHELIEELCQPVHLGAFRWWGA